VRLVAAAIGVSTVVGIALPGCREAAAPIGQGASFEVEPRTGQYSVAEFDFRNACVEPPFGLNSRAATTRSATFDLHQDSDRLGRLALSGTLRIANPTPGAADIVIFEGPDTGQYGISGDTLRVLFPKEVNQWVGVLRFTRYQAGELVGVSRGRCRSLFLRLERLP
jgi:hypothetical protein